MPIIEVDHVTKEYRLGALQGLRQTLQNTAARFAGKHVEERPMFKALDDVTFSIEQGEVVGIIGHNGAGKSTLLKMLAGISKPTAGNVSVEGRIAPLIEVGAGFVPDFTGRENVYLNGAILGMPRQEIDKKFDEIVDFAEMSEFIDTPVKRYSSGMQVKLAFSVATSVDADILIVDEVLAVGDIAFQRKCLNRMESLINAEGRTVLIVGHNIRQLERICSRMLLLKHGRLDNDGDPGKISKQFLDETTLGPETTHSDAALKPSVKSDDIDVLAIKVSCAERKEGTPVCRLFNDLIINITIKASHRQPKAEINIGLHNPEMVFITKSSTLLSNRVFDLEEGLNEIQATIKNVSICPGTYGVGLGVYDWTRRPLWTGSKLEWLIIEAPDNIAANLPQSTLSYLPTEWEQSPNSN